MKKRYKFLRENFKSNNGNETWKIGEWKKHNGELNMCYAGFHCSTEIGQAFSFVQGEILAEVEVRGKSIIENEKENWSEMRIIQAWKWQKTDSVSLAIFSARLCLKNFEKIYPDDKRPREAIKATEKWLEKSTKENEVAAEAAAGAAGAAAELAAWSAEAAARSARSAEAAAWSAAKKDNLQKIYKWFDKRINELEKIN